MPGIFSTYNTAIKGLQANSLATKTASNNIANAESQGYTRQRVILQESMPYSFSKFQVGTGVDVTNIERVRDKYLDAQIWHEYACYGSYTSAQYVMEQAEIIFNADETGLNNALTEMWTAWSDLAESPEGTNGRTIVLQATETFTGMLNQMASQTQTLKSDTTDLIASKTKEANDLISDIKALNDQIYKMNLKGLEPNSLEDQRGVLLDKLSALVNINVDYNEDSKVMITDADTGEVLLAHDTAGEPDLKMSVIGNITDDGTDQNITVYRDGDTSSPVEITVPSGTYDFSTGDVVYIETQEWAEYDADNTDIPPLTKAELKEGELAGNMEALAKLEGYASQLDDLAFAVATTVNYILTDGGTNGTPIFDDTNPDYTAANIKVNPDVQDDVTLIEAGAFGGLPGDGARALLISKLNEISLPADVSGTNLEDYLDNYYNETEFTLESDPSGRTLGGFYADIVATVGSDTQRASNGVSTQAALVAALEEREESISGVSIDEETVNLIKYSDLYAANSKVISTLTEMLDAVLNMV